jgi:hypothetical protein
MSQLRCSPLQILKYQQNFIRSSLLKLNTIYCRFQYAIKYIREMMKNDNSMRHMEDLGMDFIPGRSQLFSFIVKLKKYTEQTDSTGLLAL